MTRALMVRPACSENLMLVVEIVRAVSSARPSLDIDGLFWVTDRPSVIVESCGRAIVYRNGFGDTFSRYLGPCYVDQLRILPDDPDTTDTEPQSVKESDFAFG